MKNRSSIITILIVITLLLMSVAVVQALPDGAFADQGASETQGTTAQGSAVAQGGNITNINFSGNSQTFAWQGFWGEVTGNITLRDSSGDQLYHWPVTNVDGEIYATRSSTPDFSTVAGIQNCTIDEDLTGTSSDRVNLTFTNASVNFNISATTVTAACQTFTYVNNATQTTSFEEIIVNTSLVDSIYVTRIDSDTTGFDAVTHDYQLIVPENRTSSTTTYYFFVEFD